MYNYLRQFALSLYMAYLFMLSQPTLGIISPLLSLSPSPLSSSLSQPHPLPPSLSFSLPDYHLTLPSLPPPPILSLSLLLSSLSPSQVLHIYCGAEWQWKVKRHRCHALRVWISCEKNSIKENISLDTLLGPPPEP